jgi:hypothetical protein
MATEVAATAGHSYPLRLALPDRLHAENWSVTATYDQTDDRATAIGLRRLPGIHKRHQFLLSPSPI